MKDTINILFVCGYGVGSSVMLLDVVSLDPKQGQYLIPIENIMDGETIGQQIYEVVQQHFPHLINQ